MLHSSITLLTTILIINFFGNTPVIGQSLKDQTEITKIKTNLTKRGTGEKAKVKIELRDGSEVKGYIAELNTDDFVIADSQTGARTTIAYSEVKKVKNQGWSLGTKLGIVCIVI